jgi:PhnB protein
MIEFPSSSKSVIVPGLQEIHMARVSTYLNFAGNTEQAFEFYKSVFGTEYLMPLVRFKDAPPHPGQPPMSAKLANMVMHVELPIVGGHVLMGTDAPAEMGFTVNMGNSTHINLETDTREETGRLYQALSAGGTISMPLQDMFWGAYFASFTDQFGICWMLNCANQPAH